MVYIWYRTSVLCSVNLHKLVTLKPFKEKFKIISRVKELGLTNNICCGFKPLFICIILCNSRIDVCPHGGKTRVTPLFYEKGWEYLIVSKNGWFILSNSSGCMANQISSRKQVRRSSRCDFHLSLLPRPMPPVPKSRAHWRRNISGSFLINLRCSQHWSGPEWDDL